MAGEQVRKEQETFPRCASGVDFGGCNVGLTIRVVCQAGPPMVYFGTLWHTGWHTRWHSPAVRYPPLPPPYPHRIPSLSSVGIRWGDGRAAVAFGVPSWHSSGCPQRSGAGGEWHSSGGSEIGRAHV